MHLSWRTTALDPSYGDLDVLDQYQKEIVWHHVEEEVKSIQVLPNQMKKKLNSGLMNTEMYNQGLLIASEWKRFCHFFVFSDMNSNGLLYFDVKQVNWTK